MSGRGAGEELQQDLRKELLRRERKCESGSGVLPVARSAVPAGTRARLLLTYIRLVEGGRLQRDRRERVQRDAEGAPGAAQNDHKRRVERARAQSATEGLLLPAEHGSRPVSAQGLRRRGRAIAQADRESAQGCGAAAIPDWDHEHDRRLVYEGPRQGAVLQAPGRHDEPSRTTTRCALSSDVSDAWLSEPTGATALAPALRS